MDTTVQDGPAWSEADEIPEDECALLTYQREWVYDDIDVKISAKSRQIGITWATAYEAVMEVASLRESEGGMNVYFMSMSQDDARQFIDDCAAWIRRLSPVIEALLDGPDVEVLEGAENSPDDWFDEDEDHSRIYAYRIVFPSGFSIYALPSRPARLRGKKGYAICDEAAQQDLVAWKKAVSGLLVWGGRAAYISTYHGADNDFYKLVEDARARGISLHETNLEDALRDGLYKRICRAKLRIEWTPEGEREWVERLRRNCGDDAIYEEEFLCIVQRSGQTLFAKAEIERCTVLGPAECTIIEIRGGASPSMWVDNNLVEETSSSWARDDPASAKPDEQAATMKEWLDRHLAPVIERINAAGLGVYCGLDYGRTRNLSTWSFAFKRRDNRRRVCLIIELEKVAWPLQDFVSDYVLGSLINLVAGCGDGQGGGGNSAERAAEKTGNRVVGVNINAGWHETHFVVLGKRISAQAMQMPSHFAPLVEDLLSLKRAKGKIVAPQRRTKDGRKQTRHADAGFSLALLEQSIDGEPPPPLEDNVITIRPRRRRKRRTR